MFLKKYLPPLFNHLCSSALTNEVFPKQGSNTQLPNTYLNKELKTYIALWLAYLCINANP
uniref:Uncharacterized protein n=1 Tax=Anguilla anguilla TaxID=7936 RepID=A0A0E9SHD6_ANGAN